MRQNELITHIMADSLITATTQDKFSDVYTKMQDNAIHHLPVVEGKALIGIISRVDILKYTYSEAFVPSDPNSLQSLDASVNVSDIMTKDIVTLKDNDTIKHAVEILTSSSFN